MHRRLSLGLQVSALTAVLACLIILCLWWSGALPSGSPPAGSRTGAGAPARRGAPPDLPLRSLPAGRASGGRLARAGAAPAEEVEFRRSLDEYRALAAELDEELAAFRRSEPVFGHFVALFLDLAFPLMEEGDSAAGSLESQGSHPAGPASPSFDEDLAGRSI